MRFPETWAMRVLVDGGTPPFGPPERVRASLDATPFGHAEVWAAAGTLDSVFRTTAGELGAVARAQVADFKETRARTT
jgi:prolyl-tRNA editing enzyme YbaK/EbsC (Cys-tRNA(Pro) deacylase)